MAVGSGGYLHTSSAQLCFLAFPAPHSSGTHTPAPAFTYSVALISSLCPTAFISHGYSGHGTAFLRLLETPSRSWRNKASTMTGNTASYQNSVSHWEEVQAPISTPSGYVEAWRFSSAEELELKGSQGAGEVRFSMLQAVVPPPSSHQEKQNLKSFTGSQVGTQFPHIPWGEF